ASRRPGRLPGQEPTIYRGNTSTPHGRSPALILRTTVFVARSITETSLEGPFAVNNSFSSGESATPQGLSPASTEAMIFSELVSMVSTFRPRPVVTYSFDPSFEMVVPIGLSP